MPPAPDSPECYFMPKCARHRPTAVGTAAASPGTSCCCRGTRSSGGLGEDDGKGVLGGDSVQPVESINHFLICGMQSVAEWNAAIGRVARCSPFPTGNWVTFPPPSLCPLLFLLLLLL